MNKVIVTNAVLAGFNKRISHIVTANKGIYSLSMVMHVLAICLLCYMSSWQLVSVTGSVLFHLGMAWIDAVIVASMLGFIYLPIILIWAFSRANVLITWINTAIFAGGSVLAAWLAGAWV